MKIDMRIRSRATPEGMQEKVSFIIRDVASRDLKELACFFLRMHDEYTPDDKHISAGK